MKFLNCKSGRKVIAAYSLALLCNVSYAAPTITLNAELAPMFGIGGNINHGCMTPSGYKHVSQLGGYCSTGIPYGAWVDGPLNPYRFGNDTYFQITHAQNFRIKIPNNSWGARSTWMMEGALANGATMAPAQNDTIESHYNNKNWIFSVYSENNVLYGLTHHEWYRKTYSINGIAGFNQPGQPWIASIGWVTSSDGGNSWTMQPTEIGSSRQVIVPEPSDWNATLATWGFMHPSNIVKEGSYYYVFVSTENHSQDGQTSKNGVSLLRTSDLSTPMNWQYWDGVGWTRINHGTYQGNFGPQMPYVFWGKEHGCNLLYAMNVRKHKSSGKWITLGSKYCLPKPPEGQDFRFQAVFSWTASLENPSSLEGNISDVQQNGVSLRSNFYYSFFDVDDTADENYQSVGNNPLLVVTKDYSDYYHQFLTLTGFDD